MWDITAPKMTHSTIEKSIIKLLGNICRDRFRNAGLNKIFGKIQVSV